MEAVDRCGWRVFSYVIMSNHFHPALETPEPNLVTGMKWLQGTFATRFNRFRKESGYVFQGRYKAILVAKKLADRNPAIDWEPADYAELSEERWERMVREELNWRG